MAGIKGKLDNPVLSVDRFTVGGGDTGPLTEELARLLAGVMRGTDAGSARWRTPVGTAVPATTTAGGRDG